MTTKDSITTLIDHLLRRVEDPPTMSELVVQVAAETGAEHASRDMVRRHLERIERDLPQGYSIVRQPIIDPDEQRRKGGRIALRYNQVPPRRGVTLSEDTLLDNMLLLYQSAANLPWLPEARRLMEQMNLGDGERQDTRRCLFLDSDATAPLDDIGLRHLGDLFDAALRQYSVDIAYRRFDSELRHHNASVLALKQDDRFWYAAVCNEKSLLRAQTEGQWPFFWLAVDRVESVRLSDVPYQHVKVDWDAYFSQVIGITNPYDKPVEEVRLLAYGAMRDYLQAAPLHSSQRHRPRHDLDDEPLEVTLHVKDNHELRNRLGSMIGNVVVTVPEHLADWQRETLQQAMERIEKQSKHNM